MLPLLFPLTWLARYDVETMRLVTGYLEDLALDFYRSSPVGPAMDDQTILRNLIDGGHGADAHALAAMERMVDWVQHHGGTLAGEGSTSRPLFDEVAAELAELRHVLYV
jgi:hypothetical protein